MAILCWAAKNSLRGTILLLQAEMEIILSTQKLYVQIENNPRSSRSGTIS
jgi:hypothetical protein